MTLKHLTSRSRGAAVRLAPSVPRYIGRMPIGLLVDVSGRCDAGERKQYDSRRNPPTTIGIRGYVTIDVLHP
jgi:hypothetical protein